MGKILWEDFYGILSQLWFVDVGSLDKRQMHAARPVNYCMSVLIARVCDCARCQERRRDDWSSYRKASRSWGRWMRRWCWHVRWWRATGVSHRLDHACVGSTTTTRTSSTSTEGSTSRVFQTVVQQRRRSLDWLIDHWLTDRQRKEMFCWVGKRMWPTVFLQQYTRGQGQLLVSNEPCCPAASVLILL